MASVAFMGLPTLLKITNLASYQSIYREGHANVSTSTLRVSANGLPRLDIVSKFRFLPNISSFKEIYL